MSTLQNRITHLSPAKLALLSQRLKEKNSVEVEVQSIPRRNSADPAPLSFAQKRLWFLDQLDPGSVVYNLRETAHRRGRFDIPVFMAALNEVVRRHEILRTTFETIHGRTVQVVAPAQTVALPVVDLSALPKPEKEAQRLKEADGSRSFDLARGPLFRVTVLKLDDEDHIVVLTMHHIIFDGWSMGVFMKEVAVLYRAFLQGIPSPLPELPVQYADYAMWQREWLRGEALEQHIAYWKRQLEGAPETLLLPTDWPRPAVQTHSGASVGMVLSQELTAKLHELCRAEGATPYMLLLAVFKVLLARYTGQEDISVGTPIAGRNRVETENLIGCFLNTLVLRTDLSGNPTARELVRRVREVALGAYAHQELPFEKLLDKLRVARSLSHSPLFQVMFNMVNSPMGEFDLTEDSPEPDSISSKTGSHTPLDVRSKFDLTLYVNDKDDGIQFTLIYNPDLFTRERIVEMLDQFKHLLTQVSDDPSIEITRLSLITPRAAKLLPEPTQPIESHWSGAVHQLFAEHARKSPDRLAVTDKHESWTYGQIEERSNQLANYLIASGIQRGDVVAVYAHRSATLVWAIYGILKAGATFLILDPAFPELRLIDYLKTTKTRGWLQLEEAGAIPPALADFVETLSCCARLTLQSCTDSTLADFPADDPHVEIGPDDIACITFTSGSTGTPKGVLGRHIALTLFANWTQAQFGIDEQDRFSMLSGLAHDPLQRDIFTPLQVGASLSIPDPKEIGTHGWLASWMKEEGISVTNLTPAMGQMITETAGDAELLSLRYAFFVGDKLTRRDVAGLRKLAPSVTGINLYGTTETQRAFGFFAQESTKEELPVGRGIDGVQLLVLNAVGHLAGIGELGEIYFRSPYLARGYNEDDELTQLRFLSNPFTGIQDDRLYKTGDCGRYLPDGNVELGGRMDQQVKIRGFRIELGEIESAIAEHPAVQACAVLAREDQPGDKRLVAYLVCKHDWSITIAELRSTLKKRLPDYMVPAHFVVLDELPLTPNGKLNRLALPEPVASRGSLTEIASPRTPVEEVLAGIWCDVLRTTGIGIDENFFELGGHSLLGTQIVSRIREVFGVEISLRAIFERQTIELLAVEVERLMYQGHSLQAPPVVRTSRDVELPLSFAQQRLWFIDRLTPESPVYNMPMAVRLDGTLKLDALERTLREIVRRHEVLRTNIIDIDGKPVPVIRPEAYVDEIYLPVVDLSSLPAGLPEVEAKRLNRAESARPFNLETDALMRTTVLRLDDRQHIALLTFHHIVSDGWSMGLFVKEVVALYNAFSQGHESPLAELAVQYADYAVWQREWLQGDVLEQHIGYWKQQLEGAPELLELPTDRPRPAVQSHHGAKVGMVLSPELTGKLRELCRAEGVTLFMLLLATLKVLLARYSGHEDISVGTPIAGRNRVETEGLIGFFVNTLVMRTDLSGDPTACELLRRVREVALGAYAHQELPFEKLVDELQVERSLSHMPLFQVLFVLQNSAQELLELPGLSLSAAGEVSEVAKCDLGLTVIESGAAISGMWEYNTDLFDETTIKRLVGHFKTLLENFVFNPAQRVSELQMLTEAERQRTLSEWSREVAASETRESVQEMFSRTAARYRDNTAIICRDKQYSYGELEDRANSIANYLIAMGAQKGSLVGILADDSFHVISSIIGILKAGCVFVPFDRQLPQQRLVKMVSLVAPEWFIIESRFWDILSGVTVDEATVICVDVDFKDYFNPAKPSVEHEPDDMAYIYFTSGSTGQPKAIAGRLQGIDHFIRWEQEALGAGEGVRVSRLLPITFDASLRDIFLPLCSGGIAVGPAPRDTMLQAGKLVEWLEEHEINVIHCVPSLFRSIVNEMLTPERLPALKHILMSGEPLLPSDVGRWMDVFGDRVQLINLYGPSETTMTKFVYFVQPADKERASIPIGKPMAGANAMLVNAKGHPSEPGTIGEIYIRTPYCSLGYYNQPELTRESFIADPFGNETGEIVYKTGDLARVLVDGNYEYLGRKDQQVKIRGIRVELGEIENLLRGHEGVRDVAVIDCDDTNGFKYLCAYVVLEDGANAAELRDYLATYLPEYMLPSSFVPVQELPRTSSGKLDRRALPAPGQSRAGLETYVAPRTPVEEVLAGIWCDVLRATRAGVDDNFFELGGHSLLATQVVSRIRKAFGVEIPVRATFENQTLAKLAAEVEQLMYQGGSMQAPPLVRTSRDAELSLSFAQQRLWFIDRFEPGSPLYNMPMAVRLDGVLNVDALERTLREIVRRHEGLRTNFVTVAGKPVQVIRPEAYVDEIYLPLVDLSLLPDAAREVEAKRLSHAEAARPFNLETDALMRATVLRLDNLRHIAMLTFHHIVSDGWSMGVFVREVAALYNAFSQGLASPLPELPVQYADYAVWQREWLKGEELDQQIGYWKKQLEGAPELLELPTDRLRPVVQTHRGARTGMVLSKELTGKLHDLCRAEGVTLFMLLLATFKVLLARYSGQEDITVGTPIAGRNRVETEDLIGFFVNTLVMRTDLSGNPSVRELLRRVREVALGAYAHQELPFEKLVDELQVERSLSHTPVFQVAFALQNTGHDVLELPGLRLSAAGAASDVAKFDLTLSLSESGETITGALQYNTDLFDVATIKRMVTHFQMLLESISANPDQSIASLPLLTESERRLVLENWNDTKRPFPSDLCVHQLFEAQVLSSPDSIALIFNDLQLSYGELNERANRLAHRLRRLGVGVESTVAILMERNADVIVSLLAILKAGGCYLPLDPDYPQERLSFMLSDANVRFVLTQQHLEDRLPEHNAHVVLVDAEWPAIEQSTANLTLNAQAGNLAYVIYTSGSTGEPKGVEVTHRNIARLLFGVDYACLEDRPRILQMASISFDASTFEVWGALLHGGCCVLYPERVPNAEGIGALIARHQIDAMFITTALFNAVVDEAPQAFIGVRQLLVGGEASSIEHMRRAQQALTGVDLKNIYGPTESTTFACCHRIEELKGDERGIPIGRAIGNTQAYILGSELEVVGIGVKGELYIGGEGLARGYLKRASLTAEQFVPNPFSEREGERLYRTGDVCRYREDGAIEYVGRTDEQVKIRGFRIELGEIETVLARAEGILEAVVVVKEQAGEKRLVAYVVEEKGQELSASEIRKYLAQRLPDYMIPGAFVVIEKMPITANGKVDKKRLPEPTTDRPSLSSSYVEPQTETERTIAAILKDLLHLSEVGTEDNFFDLGGHSLLATQVVSRIREAFGVELPVRAIFEKPTIAMLSAEVEQLMSQGDSLQAAPLVRTSREGDLPLSFAQQRLWFIDRLTPESALYNIPMAVRLNGTLNLDALDRTLREIVRRHQVLRTNITNVDGKPVQVIRPDAYVDEFYLPTVDLSSLPEASREVEVKRLSRAESTRPFDLETDALMRATVLRLDVEQHIALLTFHHIIFDGWSMGVFVKEVVALYTAFSQGLASPLTELAVQYVDYAVWQQEWLQGEVLDQHIGYWKQQLEGAPELLELPTDRPRPAVQSHRGAKAGMVLSPELTGKLRELCRAEGATLFMLLLATFKVLLARYTGKEDISVGTPIAGRNRVETENLIGFFVNTLVMRTDLSGDPTACELLRRVREVALGAYAHQELPFEKLVDELQVERSLSHTPLFQVLFVLQNISEELLELPGLSLSAAGAAGSGVAKYDLTVSMSESDEVISGVLEYNTDLFDETTIKRLAGHFKTLLESFVSDPAQRLSQLQMLTDAERQRTLRELSKGSAASECLPDLFEAQVERTPEAIALVFADQEISYRELNKRANQLAHYLQGAGVREESLVGILVERSIEMVVGILGVLKAGGAYVPLDPTYPHERLSFMVADTDINVLLTQYHLAETLTSESFQTLCLDHAWPQIAKQSTNNPTRDCVEANSAYVIYTSGSTGRPKGVVVPHACAVNLTRAWLGPLGVRPGTRVLQSVSLSFDVAVGELLSLMRGATLCVPTPDTQMAGPALRELLQQQSIQTLLTTPTVLASMESDGLPRLRTVVTGGEACTAELAARWSVGRRLFNAYGPTETTVAATMSDPLDDELLPSIGRPITNLEAYVLDKYMQPVATGVAGELYLGGAGVTRGYLHRPELTAERFVPHPYSDRAGARLYQTGDIARQRADGELEYLGRVDDQVKIRGFRIELGEIANALREQTGVKECVVVALGEDGEEKRIVAYLVADEGVNTKELREPLKQRLPAHMIPAAIVQLGEMPLTRNGKVDRRALPAPEEVSSEVATNFVSPRTPFEEVLVGIWSDVLRNTGIGTDDNFFELGGHSLLAMQVLSRIREAFGVDLSVGAMFENQTLAKLAAEVELMCKGGSLEAAPLTRRSHEVELPLSFAQQRLWFIDRLTPESPLYNMPMAVRLNGTLNLDALERTLREIVRRHEVLRTNFVTDKGKPVQVIRPETYVDGIYLPTVDLSSLPDTAREVEAKRLAHAEAIRPFDLETDALLRATVLRLDAEQHIALLMFHHIIFDGWSMGVFVKEVVALYNAFSQGLQSPLAELAVQYADYAVWQQEWLQGEVLDQQIGYWKQQLEGAPELLELPTDRPRPVVQTNRGARTGLVFSPELTGKLRELCRAEGVTLFMLLLATLKVLLARYSGQDDISVGTPIAGRNRVETEGLIGFFVNTLVMRTDLSGNPTARELLRRVREVALGAYAHQELPFEKLVDELQVERSLSHTPLFQVLFVLQNTSQELLELPGLSLSAAGAASDLARFDLTLSMSESGETISGALEYNTDLFNEATIKRLVRHFETLLESFVSDPAQRLSELQLLTEAERQRTLYEWNEATDVAASETSECLPDLFEAQVERTPDAIALVFGEQEISYRELNNRANQVAHYLQGAGVREESLVGILVERSIEMVVGILGVLKAGAGYVPLDPTYPQDRLSFMVADTDVKVMLTQHHLAERFASTSFQTLCLDSDWVRIAEQSTNNPARRCVSTNTAYVIYTSGSTGRPKGVAATHAGAVNLAHAWLGALGVRPETRILQGVSLSFDVAVGELLSLMFGATLCVPTPDTQMAGPALRELLQQQSIEILLTTPTVLASLESDDLPCLLTVVTGGEACTAELAARWSVGRRLFNAYGPTETTVTATMSEPLDEERLPSIGRPLANMQTYVLDTYMQPAAIGVVGELYVGGAGVTRGYLHRPELTAEKFVPHPFSFHSGARLYRTGDYARYLDDGQLEYIGRIDEQVKVRGFRIELGEIETALREQTGVRECVVVALGEGAEKRIVAYVVADEEVHARELREALKQRLPVHMIPSAIVQLAEMPLTRNGKVDRRALPLPEEVWTEEENFVAPRTAVEEILAGIWSDVLHATRVGVNDNFFELGGHSLLATQVVSRIREAFGVEIPVRATFEKQTLASLAVEVEQLMSQGDPVQAGPLVRTSRDVELPLSFAQQRLWFIDGLTPESPLYNIPLAVRLDGALNLDALERTLREIVRRHEGLRTSFVSVQGKPVQVIRPETYVDEFYLPTVDLSSLPDASREQEAKRLANVEAARPFDLETDALMRATVLRLADQQHIAMLTFHHIISDGWSMGVFVKEVVALYSAFSQGLQSPLAELPVQYADYAVWQQEWLQGEVLEQQIGYWKQQLKGAPELLELPADRPRPAVQTNRGAHAGMVLSKELTGKLRELCRAEGSTLFMLLLATFKVLLARYTGQEDISVGTPIAGRNRVETENLIGFFVNTLVMRTDLSGNPTVRDLVRRVKEVALSAYAHQELPFEKLVDELQVERSLSHTPLFQVLFVLQNTSQGVLELPGLSLSAAGAGSGMAKFDLTLSMRESGDTISGTLEYNTDLFNETTITRIVGHFETLLDGFVSNPTQRLSELQLLTEAELQRTLSEWSIDSDETTAAEPNECVQDLFEAQVAKTPDAIAIAYGESTLTYGELNRRANQLARHLRELGVGAGQLVGLSVERSTEMMVGLLGILKAGGAYVPLDPVLPEQRLAFMLEDAQIKVLLTQQKFSSKFSGRASETICLDTDWEIIAQQSSENLKESVAGPDNLAYVLYTSGSTGQPKGVMMSHRPLVNLIAWQVAHSANAPERRTLQFASLGFDVSFQEIFSTWCAGGTLVLVEEQVRRDATALWQYLADKKIERLFAPSIVVQQLADVAGVHGETVPAHLREVCTGSEQVQVSAAVVGMFRKLNGCTLHNQYGPTEAHVVTAFNLEDTPGNWPLLPPIGRPIANAEIYVLDKHGQPTPAGVAGELHIGGVSLARGYLNRPDLTAEKFVPNPFNAAGGARLYKTGDLARFRTDGNIECLGRMDHQVKIRGFRIELGEIETALCAHAAISEAVTVVREDAPGEKRLVAYVVVHDGQVVTNADLRAFLRDRLPEYMVPQTFVMLDSLPLTPSRKVDRRALPAPDRSRPEQEVAFIELRTPFEEVLAGIWGDVLLTTGIGVNDNFFELGGHSLLATQVVSRIREAFGVEIPVRAMFEKQTLALLAAEIEQQMSQGGSLQAPPVVRTSRDVELPLSFAQQRLWFIDRFEPDSPVYNMPMAVRLNGALNFDALERTLREIVRRHEVLRTNIVTVDGKPVQVIRPEAYVNEIFLPLIDLRFLPEGLREVEAKRLANAEAARPFDLETDALMRATVLRLAEQQHIAMLTFHHIVSDGWSMGVFVKEVVALYNAFSQGLESPLVELPVQYADYAVWQQEWLQGEVLEQQIGYWKQQLEGAPELLELPTDRPRPPVQTHRGAHAGMVMSKELTAKLRELCRAEGVTLFMLLLAAFKVLLARYSGQEDISVGTPIAGRNRVETEGLIGFFINTLVLRTDLSGNPTVRELVRRVREVALGAYAHQEFPFEKLLDELQVERSLSHTPLFQVLFVLQNTSQGVLELPGLSLSAVAVASDVAKFDLSLSMSESDETISAALEYNTDLFDESTIKRMLSHFYNLFETICTDPNTRLQDLSLLSEVESRHLLLDFNPQAPALPPAVCIHQLFEAQVARRPDAVAVTCNGVHLTYEEINARANQLAHHLRSLGVGPEQRVAMLLDRTQDLVIAILGILKAGAAYLPLDPSYPQERLSFMLEDAGAQVIVTEPALAELQQTELTAVRLNDPAVVTAPTSNVTEVGVTPENAAYVIYTSGSTGQPKGVVVTHENVWRLLEVTRADFAFDEHDIWTLFHSVCFDFSVWELWGPLTHGGRLVVVPYWVSREPESFYELLREEGVTVLNQTPSAFRQLMKVDEVVNGELPLRVVIFGGEALEMSTLRGWFERHGEESPRLVNMYGITETTVHVTYRELSAQDTEGGSVIGGALTDLELYVLDRQMRAVPEGVSGELYVGGAGVARGYLGRVELTAQRFVPHPYSERAGARLYRTGDLARRRTDGELEYLGRIDEQVKIRGFRIELGEIANALREQAGVRECVVLALGENGAEKRLVAYVVAEEGGVNAGELREELKQRLPEYMIPSAIVLLAEMPLTRNGKLDKKKLPAPSTERPALASAYIEPQTETEQRIAAIWQEILHVSDIGTEDNFFDLGGNSLLALQVHARLQKIFGEQLTVVHLFEHSTIGSLAALLSRQEPSSVQEEQQAARFERRMIGKQRQRQKLEQRKRVA